MSVYAEVLTDEEKQFGGPWQMNTTIPGVPSGLIAIAPGQPDPDGTNRAVLLTFLCGVYAEVWTNHDKAIPPNPPLHSQSIRAKAIGVSLDVTIGYNVTEASATATTGAWITVTVPPDTSGIATGFYLQLDAAGMAGSGGLTPGATYQLLVYDPSVIALTAHPPWRTGIVERLYLAGQQLAGAFTLKPQTTGVETVDGLATGLSVPTQLRGWETSIEAAPGLIRKWRHSLDYRLGADDDQGVNDAEFLLFAKIAGRGVTNLSPPGWDFCDFGLVVETFRANTTRTTYRLSAGIGVQENGLSGAPGCLPGGLALQAADGYAAYATELRADGTLVVADSWGSRDAFGRQSFVWTGSASRLSVVHVQVRCVHPLLTDQIFAPPHREYARLMLESF